MAEHKQALEMKFGQDKKVIHYKFHIVHQRYFAIQKDFHYDYCDKNVAFKYIFPL